MFQQRKLLFVILLALIPFMFSATVLLAEELPKAATTSKKQTAKAKTTKTKSASKTKASAKPTVTPKPVGNTSPLGDFELARYQYCGKDSDCVVSANGCCDCANGTKEVAVNKERLQAFRERFDCLYFQCGTKRADPPCQSGVVSCLNHRCVYFDEAREKTEEKDKF